MKNKKSSPLVPSLRFPEFREAGEWVEKKLGSLIEIKGRIGYRGYAVEDIVGEGKGAISLSPSNISGAGELSFNKSTYISWDKYEESPEIMLKAGFTVLVKTGSSYGKAALIQALPIESTINPQLVILKPIKIDSIFLFLTVSNLSIQKQIKENVVGGAIPTLSQENISKFNIFIPCQKEQQKIAACLSSLDELITAHSQKLDALKKHKKGLMQQLFPAEGQTVPSLRFPEFREAGEWVEKTLQEVSNFINQKISSKEISLFDYVSTENILPDYDGITTASKLPPSGNVTYFIKNDILISNIRPYLKKIWFANKNGGASNDVIVVRAKTNISNKFLSFLLKNDEFINYAMKGAKGVKMPRGDISLIKEYPLAIPSLPEQQKIAACLSSLDELITAQSQKLDALKKHKKGLMQRLFPVVEEEKH